MTPRKHNSQIVIVARQAGSASAFVPLYEDIRKSGLGVRTFAFSHAHKLFAANGIESLLIERFDDAMLGAVANTALVLTGTSEFANEDQLFWRWAKCAGIPSVAFVDSWVSYWQRFTPDGDPSRKFGYAPDFIAVVDKFMHSRMVAYGCDQERLITTGNPAFDVLRQYAPREKQHIVRRFGEDYLLFVDEPFNSMVRAGNEKDALGYTELEVLAQTMTAMEGLANQVTRMVFRPHPRSWPTSEIVKFVSDQSNISLDTGEFDSRDLVACAKVIVGMTSMMLYEASVMGVPAVSIQPNSKKQSDLIELSGIPVVRQSSSEALRQAISRVLALPPDPPRVGRSTLFDAIRAIASSPTRSAGPCTPDEM